MSEVLHYTNSSYYRISRLPGSQRWAGDCALVLGGVDWCGKEQV